MNVQLLRIFLEDPKPWVHSDGSGPKSILAPFSALNCKEVWIRSDEYPSYTPANGGREKSYVLSGQSDRIYRIEYEGDDGAPEIKGNDIWVYSALRLSVRCQKNISAPLEYPPVMGSLRFQGDDEMEEKHCDHSVFNPQNQQVTFTKDGWVTYCPVLSMRLKKMQCSTSPDQSKWSLELIEKHKKEA